jgi:hypothetical protein
MEILHKDGTLALAIVTGDLAGVKQLLIGAPEAVDSPLVWRDVTLRRKFREVSPRAWIACYSGQLAIARWLVEEVGADVEQPDRRGLSPCFAVCSTGRLEVVRWLAEECAVDIRRPAGAGSTTLFHRVQQWPSSRGAVVGRRARRRRR